MDCRFVVSLTISALCVGILCGCDSSDTTQDDNPNINDNTAPSNAPPDFGDNNRAVCVAMGDSITVGHNGPDATLSGYPEVLAPMLGRAIVNEAIDGSDSGDGKGIVNRVLRDHKPAYLLILYGANDVISSMPQSTSIVNLQTMIRAAKANKTIPVIATLLPMSGPHKFFAGSVELLNTKIRQLAQDETVTLIDLYPVFMVAAIINAGLNLESPLMTDDGLHPNDAGQRVIASEFARGVEWAPIVPPSSSTP